MDASIKSTTSDFESLLQCRLCNKQIIQPKFLPCFHRFCFRCIKQYTKDTSESARFKCPECETEFHIGKDGITGLQADLYSESLIECLQLQGSLRDTQTIRECFCCSQESVSSAYCFKCPGFLCKSCLHIHENNRIAKDHKASLKVLCEETRSIVTEELLSLKGLPRCKTHPSETEMLFCESCNGKTICVECWSYEHSDHKVVSAHKAAKDCALKVDEQMEILTQYITKISNFVTTEEKSSEEANKTMEEEKRQIRLLQEDIRKTEKEVQVEDSKIDEKKKLLISEEKVHIRELKTEMEQKINKIKEKYERHFEERRKETQVRVQELEKSRNKEFTERKSQLLKKVIDIQKSLKDSMEYMESTKQTMKKIHKFTTRFETLKERLCDLQRSADVCIIAKLLCTFNSAINTLIQEFGKEYPRILSITSMEVKTSVVREEAKITAEEEASVKITQPSGPVLYVETMTGLKNDNVIMVCRNANYNGKDPEEYHVIIADINGKIVIQRELKELQGLRCSLKYLACFERDKVLILSNKSVFVTKTKDLSYEIRSIQKIVSPEIKRISCMATDVKNKRLILCYDMTIYVTDSELRLADSFVLSCGIGTCDAIAVLNNSMYTCDFYGKKAFVLSRKGLLSQILDNPQITRCQWRPMRICTDGNKYVYFLWEGGRNGNIVVQYEQNQTKTLAIRRVDEGFNYITILRVDGQVKLILGKRYGMVLLIYGLKQKITES